MEKMGYWWIESKKDSRWNRNGQGVFDIFSAEDMMMALIAEMKKDLGNMPDDLAIGFMKD